MTHDIRRAAPRIRTKVDRLRSRAVAALLAAAALGAGPGSALAQDSRLYRPRALASTVDAGSYAYEVYDQVAYTTAGGFERRVPIAVRFPPGPRQGRLPAVIVAHGGGNQPNDRNPGTTLPEWGVTLARAGYVAINVLHGSNLPAQNVAMCQAIGYEVFPPAQIGATLQQLIAAMVQASQNGAIADVDLQQLALQYPGLFDDLLTAAGPGGQELATVTQVVDRLQGNLQGCVSINGLGLVDRPHDVAAVVDALHDGRLPAALVRRIDLDRIGMLGHSNGTNSVLGSVGLRRALPNGIQVIEPLPVGNARRPRAVVALSPMGINDMGLFDSTVWTPGRTDSKEHSWSGPGLVDMPVLTITGDGDNHCETRYVCTHSDSASSRTSPFHRMPAGDKYLMYVADIGADEIVSSHEMFGSLDHPDVCQAPALAGPCAATVQWIKSTAIAFLDAYVRDIAAARLWLRSANLERVSGGIATIATK